MESCFLLIFSLICCVDSDTVTVLVNHSAILHGQIGTNATTPLNWRFLGINQSNDEIVYKDSRIQPKYKNAIFASSETKDRHSYLFIPKTTYNLAGTYFCLQVPNRYELKLLILESNPKCKTYPRIENSSISLNGSDLILSCIVRYRGSESPPMRWNIEKGQEIPANETTVESNETNNTTTVESSIRIHAESEFLTHSPIKFTFTMVFFALNLSDRIADELLEQHNYSEYKYVWQSPEIHSDLPKQNTTTTSTIRDGQSVQQHLATIAIILVGIVFALVILLSMIFLLKNLKENRSRRSRFNKEIPTRRAAKPVYKNDNVSRNQLNPPVNHRTRPWLGQSRNRVPCLETADLPIVAYAESRTNESFRNRSYDSSTIEPVNRIETEDFSIPAYAESRTNESLTSGTYNSSMNEPVNRIETEDFSMAAYAESRTNESLSSGTYNSSMNEPVNRIDTLSGTEKQPSVNSAMPVYAEVFKSSLRRNHLGSAPDSSDITPYATSMKSENKHGVENQNTEVIGELDGTVYTEVSRKNKEVGDNRAPKVPKKNTFYAKVDHTQQIPPPMSKT